MNGREARQRYGPGLWQAPHHVGASPGTIVASRMSISRPMPPVFASSALAPSCMRTADGGRWPCARSSTQLTIGVLLERLWRKGAGQRLPKPISAAESAALEGLMTETVRYSRRRSGLLRAEALRRAGGVCAACGRQYSTYLDGLGERVLQVHHRRQLAATDVPRLTRSSDLAVLCANCHALVHSNPRRSLPVERLRTMIQAAPNPPLQLAGSSRS